MSGKPPATAPAHPVYVITLRPEPNTDHESAVRALLKFALRSLRLRCVSVTTTEENEP